MSQTSPASWRLASGPDEKASGPDLGRETVSWAGPVEERTREAALSLGGAWILEVGHRDWGVLSTRSFGPGHAAPAQAPLPSLAFPLLRWALSLGRRRLQPEPSGGVEAEGHRLLSFL